MRLTHRRIAILEGSPVHIGLRVFRAAAIVAVVVCLPSVFAPFRITQVTGACTYAIVIVGLNLLSGFGGQISLGHAAFFGLGAYTTGILTVDHGMPPLLTFPISIVLAFVVGAIVALPALRLRGIYVALVTLAVGLIFPALVSRFDSLTHGPAGLFGVSYDPPHSLSYFGGFNGATLWHYWLVVLALGLVCLVARNLVRSRFGRAVVALRDNESAAVVMGVRRTASRALIFGISAAIAALAGSLFAVTNGILTPDSFSLLLTLYFLAGMVIGGTATLWGPIYGGFIVYFVPVWATDLSGLHSGTNLAGVFLGVIIIVITFALRTGVQGLLHSVTGLAFELRPRTPSASGAFRKSRVDRAAHEDRAAPADETIANGRDPGSGDLPDGATRPVRSDATPRL